MVLPMCPLPSVPSSCLATSPLCNFTEPVSVPAFYPLFFGGTPMRSHLSSLGWKPLVPVQEVPAKLLSQGLVYGLQRVKQQIFHSQKIRKIKLQQ
eukprot:843051-Pelagomonas_calceolata.AAC.1